MSKKRITMLVSNDLVFDQRVSKVCESLLSEGFVITLLGIRKKDSTNLQRAYRTVRLPLFFSKGALFYAALNIRFFFFLLFNRVDIIHANDLDTLPAAYAVARLRRKIIVYDSHEYFTEAQGLTGRNFQKRFWERIEKTILPKLKNVFTVNKSIASIYEKKYGVRMNVLRNIPTLNLISENWSRSDLNLPLHKKIVILQGAYIDPDRGGIEAVESMKFVDGALLLIIGSGRDMENLKLRAQEKDLNDKIRFLPRIPFLKLREYTRNADLGLSLDKPVHLNYTFSLPNKIFDYIHAGIPVLASDLPELRYLVSTWKVGEIISEVEPESLGKKINEMLYSPKIDEWKTNTIAARKELNWQKESEVLLSVYRKFL